MRKPRHLSETYYVFSISDVDRLSEITFTPKYVMPVCLDTTYKSFDLHVTHIFAVESKKTLQCKNVQNLVNLIKFSLIRKSKDTPL